MSCIDNGEFWDKVTKDFDDCEEIFYNGQGNEHIDIKAACNFYEKYVIQCGQVFDYIKTKAVHLRKIKYRYYKATIKGVLGGLLLGILGSIIASMIWASAVEPVFNEVTSNTSLTITIT